MQLAEGFPAYDFDHAGYGFIFFGIVEFDLLKERTLIPSQLAAVILGTVETGIAECYPPWQYSAYPPMSLTRCLL